MATLPGGMSVADAEALSKQQTAEQRKRLPVEGSYFLKDNIIYQRQGDKIVGLGFEYPKDWQGKTIRTWQGEQTSKGLAALQAQGITVAQPTGIEAAYLREALDLEGIGGGANLTDVNQFVTQTQAYSPIAGAAPTTNGATDPIASIRAVFGPTWNPSPAFTPELQSQGVYGAVRVEGSGPTVFTLGPSGRAETAASFKQKFGTSNQEGIVGLVSPEQARRLGITPKAEPTEEITAGDLGGPGLVTGVGGDTTGGIYGDTNIGISDNVSNLVNILRQKITDTESRVNTLVADLKERGDDAQSTSDLLQEQWNNFGIQGNLDQQKSMLGEIDVLNTGIANLEGERDVKIIGAEELGMPNVYIYGRQERIQRAYNSRIAAQSAIVNSKATILSALQGQLTQAQGFASDMVDALVYDTKKESDDIKYFIDHNKDLIDDLGKEYKGLLDTIKEEADTRYNRAKDEADGKRNLLIDAANKGVSLDIASMTLDEATAEYGKKVANQVRIDNAPVVPEGPDTYSDEEIRAVIRSESLLTDPATGLPARTYQQTIDGITLNPNLANKDRWRLIAAELYGEEIPLNLREEQPIAPIAPITLGEEKQAQRPNAGLSPGDIFEGYEPVKFEMPSFVKSLY